MPNDGLGSSMSENKKILGDGVIDYLTSVANQELSSFGESAIRAVFKFLQDKFQDINFDELIAKLTKRDKEEITLLWSSQLVEEGLLPKGYADLPDGLLVHNLHQEGYLDGLYVGYVLAMMSLEDNHAPKELILSVRDDIKPKLLGNYYENRDELLSPYKSEKYGWIERLTISDCSRRLG